MCLCLSHSRLGVGLREDGEGGLCFGDSWRQNGYLAEAPEATIIVELRHLEQFQKAALKLKTPTRQLSKIEGFNISKGQFVELYFISSIKFDDKSLNG